MMYPGSMPLDATSSLVMSLIFLSCDLLPSTRAMSRNVLPVQRTSFAACHPAKARCKPSPASPFACTCPIILTSSGTGTQPDRRRHVDVPSAW